MSAETLGAPERSTRHSTPACGAASRIAVIGCPGSGKTFLSHRLARATGLPLYHLDDLYWGPGWVPTPADVWRATVDELAARDRWIIDGNYVDTLGARLGAADTVVMLDLPTSQCLLRVARRYMRMGLGDTADLPERVRAAPGRPRAGVGRLRFLHFVATFRRKVRPRLLVELGRARGGAQVVRLQSARQADEFLASFTCHGTG